MEVPSYRLPGDGKRATERPTVLLAYCHPGLVRHEFMRSILGLLQYEDRQYDIGLSDAFTGPLISRARCMISETFLATDKFSHLLFIDSDIGFQPSDLDTLLELDKPIVGALYYGVHTKDYSLFPTALVHNGEDYVAMEEVPETGTHEVDGIGMGFTLIKREVMEAVGADANQLIPFAEAVIDGKCMGEDLTFCLRAKEKGYSTWLAAEVRVGHMKTVMV